MSSNCGITSVEKAIDNPIQMIESGPSSGMWGAAMLGKLINAKDLIAIDIGGTTAKCSLI
jgi:N-methylhydantoinase A